MSKLLLLGLLVIACTKPNPNRCCTDEADCAAAELPVGSTCATGLVCRGNQCIAEPCSASNECEASAPYCVAEFCAESCTDDAQCPGFGQSTDKPFCIDGQCVECRDSASGDCPAAAPVCDASACRVCQAHSECPLGVCAADGTCVDAADVALVDPAGSDTSNCDQAVPCSLTRAFAVTPARKYLLLRPGTYANTSTVLVTGPQRWIIGSGTRPTITRSTQGPIFTIDEGTDVTFENVQISGATGTTTPAGRGIDCPLDPPGARTVRLRDVTIAQHADSGVRSQGCTVHAFRSNFVDNGAIGMDLRDSNGTVDRCTFAGNQLGAISFDDGIFELTNSFIYRNGGGISFYSTSTGNRFEFNTIVDNGNAIAGVACAGGSAPSSHPNNIIVRNMPNTVGNTCTFPSSLVLETDIAAVKFKSPDAPPYDYHLTAGSTAIDLATQSTVDHDFDGEPRTAPRDVGADELVP